MLSQPGQDLRACHRRFAPDERDHIVATLERTSFRIAGEGGAAALLALNPSTLRGRIQKLGIFRPSSRPGDASGLIG